MTETTMIQAPAAMTFTEGTALYQPTDAGLLRLTDVDRADFLHRMTTNEINKLPVGHATVTVLTSATARIRYVFTVLCRADELWVLPSPGEATALERHLRSQIFFMDKVKVANLSEPYQRLRVMGPDAETALSAAGFAVAPLTDGAWMEVVGPEDSPTVVLKQLAYAVPGFELITPTANLATIQAQLHAAGAVTIDAATYEARRIELGRPAPGHELTEAYNPLEAGIGWTCSDNKGCYTGQEIIARQITYDKITKSLVGLQSATLLPVGTELQAEGRAVGTVTSSALSLRGQSPLALAIVKRPHHEPGSDLRTGTEPVTVTALPFVE